MLLSVKQILKYKILAEDGIVGKVQDFYFDDKTCSISYLVVKTGNWLSYKLVLISVSYLKSPRCSSNVLPVKLTKEKIERCPSIDKAKPVSVQKESSLGSRSKELFLTPSPFGIPVVVEMKKEKNEKTEDSGEKNKKADDPHLRSVREIIGYLAHPTDGRKGMVDDFIVNDEKWILQHMVIDTRKWFNWFQGDRKVLIMTNDIERIDWTERLVYVKMTSNQIEVIPAYSPSISVNRKFELNLYDFYGRLQRSVSNNEF